MNTDRYNEIKKYISTGDLLAFSGKGFVSGIIKLGTLSQYSHVGMAVWLNFPDADKPALYIAESTTLSTVPDITGQPRKGFQIVNLDERIKSYDGKAWLCKLHEPLAPHEAEVLKNFVLKCHAENKGYDTKQAIEAGLDCKFLEKLKFRLGIKKRSDLSLTFCSEVAGAGLVEVSRLSANTDVSELTPEDVVNLPCFEKPYQL